MRRQPRIGNRRFDAAINHFTAMGYAARDVRVVVGALVKLYGGPCRVVWRFLEEGNYEVVQTRFLQIEEEKRQRDLQQGRQQVEDEPPQEFAPKELKLVRAVAAHGR